MHHFFFKDRALRLLGPGGGRSSRGHVLRAHPTELWPVQWVNVGERDRGAVTDSLEGEDNAVRHGGDSWRSLFLGGSGLVGNSEAEDTLEDFFELFFFFERRGMELGFTVDDPGGVMVADPLAVADPVADAGGVGDGAVTFTCGMVFAAGVAFACGALFAAGVSFAGAAASAGGIAADSEEARVLRVPVGGTVSRSGKGVGGRIFSTSSEISRPCSCCKSLREI